MIKCHNIVTTFKNLTTKRVDICFQIAKLSIPNQISLSHWQMMENEIKQLELNERKAKEETVEDCEKEEEIKEQPFRNLVDSFCLQID